MIDWLVIGALVMSLINAIAIIRLGKLNEELTRVVDHLIFNAMIISEIIQREEQENNADD